MEQLTLASMRGQMRSGGSLLAQRLAGDDGESALLRSTPQLLIRIAHLPPAL
jgi:hypothetical protein